MSRANVRIVILLTPLLGGTLSASPRQDLHDLFRQAARRVAPSVVTIETVGGTQPTEANPRRAAYIVADGPTTGLIWSADGLVLTSSFNFVRDPSVITVVLADGRRFVAELLARDEIRRLAMLKIQADGLPVPDWADEHRIRPGQWAISLGRGHGRMPPDAAASTGGCTLTAGIISAVGRMSGVVLQTDAHLSPANFGGPLVDLDGRVMGLCVPLAMDGGELSGIEWYDSGIGFAVPRGHAEISAADLALKRNVRRGLLGVAISALFPQAVVVAAVGDPSPAARAGIQAGDRIVGIDDQVVGTFLELRRVLRPRSAGTRVRVHVQRGEQKVELSLRLAVPEDIGPVPQPEMPHPPQPEHPDDLPRIPPASGPS